jgi:hypothetical protein
VLVAPAYMPAKTLQNTRISEKTIQPVIAVGIAIRASSRTSHSPIRFS